jgi:hypothetical protein
MSEWRWHSAGTITSQLRIKSLGSVRLYRHLFHDVPASALMDRRNLSPGERESWRNKWDVAALWAECVLTGRFSRVSLLQVYMGCKPQNRIPRCHYDLLVMFATLEFLWYLAMWTLKHITV